MAAFFIDRCQWMNCGQLFSTRLELIVHIETKHIEVDRNLIEKQELQQPQALPLSYVNRFFTDSAANARKHEKLLAELGVSGGSAPLLNGDAVVSNGIVPNGEVTVEGPSAKRRKTSSRRSSVVAATAGNEEGGESAEVDCDSDDSWNMQDHFTGDDIRKMMTADSNHEKPFRCAVPTCGKRYKNVQGMKQHAKSHIAHGQKAEGPPVKKTHKCSCGKSYKSATSLRQHRQAHHGETPASGKAVRPGVTAVKTVPLSASPASTASFQSLPSSTTVTTSSSTLT